MSTENWRDKVKLPRELPSSRVPQDGDRWGRWRYDAKNLTLDFYPDDRKMYEFDLEQLRNPWGLSHAIFHLVEAHRGWMTATDLGNVLWAIYDLLDPQRNLIHGENLKFDVGKHLKGAA